MVSVKQAYIEPIKGKTAFTRFVDVIQIHGGPIGLDRIPLKKSKIRRITGTGRAQNKAEKNALEARYPPILVDRRKVLFDRFIVNCLLQASDHHEIHPYDPYIDSVNTQDINFDIQHYPYFCNISWIRNRYKRLVAY